MALEAKPRSAADSIVEALRSEIVGAPETLAIWIRHLQGNGGIATLFEFEVWLRGLAAFFDVHHLPLDTAERDAIANRSFTPEIRVARLALQQCETVALQIAAIGADAPIAAELPPESRGLNPAALPQMGSLLAQSTPVDSLEAMLEAVDDLGSTMDAIADRLDQDLKLFLSLGRTFHRNLRSCRYMELLIAQRFRPEYDRVDNATLSTILRSMPDERERRNLTLGLLYLHRFLRYLGLISVALDADRPLRAHLVIFSLLHEQSEVVCDFLKSQFQQRRCDPRLQSAAELAVHSIRSETQRVFDCELKGLTAQHDARLIYTGVENSHGLLRSCYQNAVVTLVQALDEQVDPKALFPSMLEGLQQGQKLRKDLWDLRQALRNELEKAAGLDLSEVLDRIAQFRESSLRLLMYRDWGEFERCSEQLITSPTELEARALVRKFVGFLESLIQQVSKRRVLQ